MPIRDGTVRSIEFYVTICVIKVTVQFCLWRRVRAIPDILKFLQELVGNTRSWNFELLLCFESSRAARTARHIHGCQAACLRSPIDMTVMCPLPPFGEDVCTKRCRDCSKTASNAPLSLRLLSRHTVSPCHGTRICPLWPGYRTSFLPRNPPY